ISEASSAREALRIVGDDLPDIILADIAMPGQDGYSLIGAIRAMSGGAERLIRSIAVTAYARTEDKQRARAAGFDDHVCKPVQLGDLFDSIERVWLRGARP